MADTGRITQQSAEVLFQETVVAAPGRITQQCAEVLFIEAVPGTGFCNLFSTVAAISIKQSVTTEVGVDYQLTFDIDTIVTGSLSVLDEVNADFSEVYSTTGSKSIIFRATTTSTQISIKGTGLDITVDNISCKEVSGATFGLQCVIDNTTSIYGQMTVAWGDSEEMRARFYINAEQLEMADGDQFRVFFVNSAAGAPFILSVVQTAGVQQVKLTIENDVPAQVNGTVQTLTSGERYIELLMKRATTNVASDGVMELHIDGTKVDEITGIDNFDRAETLSNLRLGAASGLDSTTKGDLWIDELVVRDDGSEIGA